MPDVQRRGDRPNAPETARRPAPRPAEARNPGGNAEPDGNRGPLVPEARGELDALKHEVAQDLGLDDDIRRRGWGNMTTREVGRIGGNMTRRMVEFAEENLGGAGARGARRRWPAPGDTEGRER